MTNFIITDPRLLNQLARRYASESREVRLIADRKVWQFPDEPFVTYESSDERWCRPLGIGREVTVTDEVIFQNAIVEFEFAFSGNVSRAVITVITPVIEWGITA